MVNDVRGAAVREAHRLGDLLVDLHRRVREPAQ
jgi:hypothetical protein